ncbi:MAG: hypothetical protein NTY12_00155 [Candidatus Falkowbacteria bacterium]|nr:hypothetical protein [Candidatus Falkowbacteria bacterium]
MNLMFSYIGDVYVTRFSRRLSNGIGDILNIYSCSIDYLHCSDVTGRAHLRTTIPYEQVEAVEIGIREYADNYSKKKPGPKLKFKFLGHKYELRFPEKHFKALKADLKKIGCKAGKMSSDPGDGNINIYVTMPHKRIVEIKKYIKNYVKELGY